LAASSIVLSAIFSLYLYNRLSYGTYPNNSFILTDINRREFYLFLSLLIPTFLLGIFPNVILDSLHVSVSSLIYNTPINPI
jgi:NADH-ubiquinone oxidoreductase chain 4